MDIYVGYAVKSPIYKVCVKFKITKTKLPTKFNQEDF